MDDSGTAAGTLTLPGLSNVVIRRRLPTGATSDCPQAGNTMYVIALNAGGATLNQTASGPGVYSSSVCGADGTSVATGLPGAYALADDGRVAGYTTSGSLQDGTFAFVPVVRSADATVTQLPVPAGKSGRAYAFGPDGTVIGETGTATLHLDSPRPYVSFDAEQAVVWQNGQLTQLGTLGGATSTVLAGRRTVSRTGDIVGTSVTSTGEAHAFLWRGGRMIDLGAPGGPSSSPVSINDTGQIVGTVQAVDGTNRRAVRWTIRGA